MSTASYYDNPLIGRYASAEMSALWGPQRKFSTWRRLWVALAEAEADLGVPISKKQIEQLRAHTDDVDFLLAARYERNCATTSWPTCTPTAMPAQTLAPSFTWARRAAMSRTTPT